MNKHWVNRFYLVLSTFNLKEYENVIEACTSLFKKSVGDYCDDDTRWWLFVISNTPL